MHIASSSVCKISVVNSVAVFNVTNTSLLCHLLRSSKELAVLDRVRRKFEYLKETDYEHIKSPDVFVKMDKVWEEGGAVGIGRAVTVVDAAAEDCAAWEWAKMTRQRIKLGLEGGDLERNIVKLNDHTELYHVVIDLGVPGFQPREWLSKTVWKKQDDESLGVVYEDFEHKDFPEQSGKYVRASSVTFWKFEELPPRGGVPQTKVSFSQRVDPKGLIPKFLVNSKIAFALMTASDMRKEFDKR